MLDEKKHKEMIKNLSRDIYKINYPEALSEMYDYLENIYEEEKDKKNK